MQSWNCYAYEDEFDSTPETCDYDKDYWKYIFQVSSEVNDEYFSNLKGEVQYVGFGVQHVRNVIRG